MGEMRTEYSFVENPDDDDDDDDNYYYYYLTAIGLSPGGSGYYMYINMKGIENLCELKSRWVG